MANEWEEVGADQFMLQELDKYSKENPIDDGWEEDGWEEAPAKESSNGGWELAPESSSEPVREALPDNGVDVSSIVSRMAKESVKVGFGDYTFDTGISLEDIGSVFGSEDFAKETTAELIGVGHSMSMVPRGLKQLAGIDEEQMKTEEAAMDVLYADEELGTSATAGMVVGAVVEPAGMLMPGMKAANIGGQIVKGAAKTNVIRAAVGSAIYGGAAYTKEQEDESFLESKAKQIATFAAFGAGAGTLFGGTFARGAKSTIPKGAPPVIKKEVSKAYSAISKRLSEKAKETGEKVRIDDAGVYIAAEKQIDDIDLAIARMIKDDAGEIDPVRISQELKKNMPFKFNGLRDATKVTGRKPRIGMTRDEAEDVINYFTKAARQSELAIGADKVVGMLSTRIGNKSQRLLGRLERHFHDNNKAEKAALDKVDSFMGRASEIFGRPTGKQKIKDVIAGVKGEKIDKVKRAAEYDEFSAKMLSGDYSGIRNMLRGKGYMSNSHEIKSLDNLQDWLGSRARHLVKYGILKESQVIDNYFPRIVKDLEGLKTAVGSKMSNQIDDALNKAEAKMMEAERRTLNQAERASVLNSVMVKYPKGIQTKGGGYTKGRTMEEIDPKLVQFYEDPLEALHTYVRNSTQDIGKAKLFGKVAQKEKVLKKDIIKRYLPDNLTSKISKDEWWNDTGKGLLKKANKKAEPPIMREGPNGTPVLDESRNIGRLLNEELEAGNISTSDVQELQEIMDALFSIGQKSPSSIVQGTRNIMYASLLANPISAAVQFGDVAISMYINGFRNTIETIAPAAKHTLFAKKGYMKSIIQDMGLRSHITEEFASTGKTAKFLKVAMKASGFEKVDTFGKEVAVRAALNKASKMTSTEAGKKAFIAQHKAKYGNEIYKIAEDLKAGKASEEAQVYLFSELSRMQPISKLELPEMYHRLPNGRIMYMLKSFMLKQMDIVRRDGIQKMMSKNPKVQYQGAKSLTGILVALGAGGTASGVIQELMKGNLDAVDEAGDPVKWVTNMTKTFGLSEYTMRKIGKADIGDAIGGIVLPPYAMFDDVWQERKDELELNPKAVKKIPVFGKPAYYWLMGGIEKEIESKAYWAKQDEYKRKRIAKREARGE